MIYEKERFTEVLALHPHVLIPIVRVNPFLGDEYLGMAGTWCRGIDSRSWGSRGGSVANFLLFLCITQAPTLGSQHA